MGLEFKNLNTQLTPNNQTIIAPPRSPQPNITRINRIGIPLGQPMGLPVGPVAVQSPRNVVRIPPPQIPGEGLERAINYYADYAGCGWWRMIAPETLLNIENRAIINGLSTMIIDPRFYTGVQAVRLQRQATPVQLEFVKFLHYHSQEFGFKKIYEIDDIIFKDDIPDFNRCKSAFEDENILRSSIEMMQICDEITVTCQYMKDYYIDKTGNKKITVIPNYPAKMWMDNHYFPNRLMRNFVKHKVKPRIAYIGSGTHIDVTNKTNQHDDFAFVVDTIIKTRKDFHWVFVGAFPLRCQPFIGRGEMEFIRWFPLKDLAKAYTDTNCQAVYAPLLDCTFNEAKSNIKYLEAGCCGVPGVFQDLVTYEMAPLRFTTGDQLIDQLKLLLKDEQTYEKYSKEARAYADTMWLDDHLDEYWEAYFTTIGEPNRKALIRLNPDQKSNITYENSLLKQ